MTPSEASKRLWDTMDRPEAWPWINVLVDLEAGDVVLRPDSTDPAVLGVRLLVRAGFVALDGPRLRLTAAGPRLLWLLRGGTRETYDEPAFPA